MLIYSREDLYRNLSKEDLKGMNKDLEKELGIGNFCYSPEIDLNTEDFLSQYDNTKDKEVFLQDLYSLLKIANEKNNVEEVKNIQNKINLLLIRQLKNDVNTTSKANHWSTLSPHIQILSNEALILYFLSNLLIKYRKLFS